MFCSELAREFNVSSAGRFTAAPLVIPSMEDVTALRPNDLKSGLNREALTYWYSKCRGRAMPSRADIVPSEIIRLLPHVFLLDVQSQPLDFRYRLIGTLMDECMHGRYTGKSMRDIPHQAPPSSIFSACSEVVIAKRPMTSTIPYVGRMSAFRHTEDVLLPLSENGDAVTMLMVTADFI